jgi:BirA family transcriptional regulator, biotin operon repressor / biotin---[acetyl-CoA-carboxylase] ligase
MVNWTFIEFDNVGSTQTTARDLAARGAPEGTVVVAKSQSSGVGRLGRRWVSPEGGLYMSFVLRPGNLPRPELVTLVSAVAVVEGIKRTTDLSPSIRWPNDVMVNRRKLAGVIAEAQSYEEKVRQIITGVGVNCNGAPYRVVGPEGEATSIEEELGRKMEISELKHSILTSFSQLYDRWKAGEDMAHVWREHVATLGKTVSVKLQTDETPFSCVASEIDFDGALVVTKGSGKVAIHPEDLEWLRELF